MWLHFLVDCSKFTVCRPPCARVQCTVLSGTFFDNLLVFEVSLNGVHAAPRCLCDFDVVGASTASGRRVEAFLLGVNEREEGEADLVVKKATGSDTESRRLHLSH